MDALPMLRSTLYHYVNDTLTAISDGTTRKGVIPFNLLYHPSGIIHWISYLGKK